MKWAGRRESTNVEDRRGFSGGGLAVGGGIVGVIVILLKVFLGGDTSDLNQVLPQGGPAKEMSAEEQKKDDERASFVKVVLADTEDVWAKLFSDAGKTYTDPTLVLFRESVQSACGMAGSPTGPFYCPGDQKLYLDLSFFEEMQNHLHAGGD